MGRKQVKGSAIISLVPRLRGRIRIITMLTIDTSIKRHLYAITIRNIRQLVKALKLNRNTSTIITLAVVELLKFPVKWVLVLTAIITNTAVRH